MDYLDHAIPKLGNIINSRFSKLQQIFRPRIILLIQVHTKKVYSREIKKYQLGSVGVRENSFFGRVVAQLVKQVSLGG